MEQVSFEIQLKQVPIGSTSIGLNMGLDPFVHQYVALVQTRYTANGPVTETVSSIHGLATVASDPGIHNTVMAAPGLNSNL